jgi:hypothetical protein
MKEREEAAALLKQMLIQLRLDLAAALEGSDKDNAAALGSLSRTMEAAIADLRDKLSRYAKWVLLASASASSAGSRSRSGGGGGGGGSGWPISASPSPLLRLN